MLLPVERTFRWRPPVGSLGSFEEVVDVDSDDEDVLDEGCLVFSLICRMVAMFLMRTMDRAAAQSMKAKVAPFHNFILERGGALKLCEEERH